MTLGGTAGATTGTVTGSGTTYNVAVSGMTGSGTVIATHRAPAWRDRRQQPSERRLHQHGQHRDLRRHAADGDDQPGGGQADPTGRSPINFTVVFSESVSGFATGDVTLGGTAGGTLVGAVTRQRHDLQRGRQRDDAAAAR